VRKTSSWWHLLYMYMHFHKMGWIDLSPIPTNNSDESRSGWQKYSKCMKMSTPTSLWCYCSYVMKWNVGKVYSALDSAKNSNKPCRQEQFPQRKCTCSCTCCCAHHERSASQMTYIWNKKRNKTVFSDCYLIARFTINVLYNTNVGVLYLKHS